MNWRALTAAVVFVALLVAGVLLSRQGTPAEQAPPPPSATPAPPPPISPALPPLTRADLIDATARAADAAGFGKPPPPENAGLAGRRFILRLPFGCGSMQNSPDVEWASWRYDADNETLRLSVRPEDWSGSEFLRALSLSAPLEGAEGFWLSRPWLRSGDCPAALPTGDEQARPITEPDAAEKEATPAPGSALASETIALVQLFQSGAPRAARRNGKPYELVVKLAPGEIDLERGLRLIVEGRLAPFSTGHPILCRSRSRNERPLCLVSVENSRIAVTDASGDRILGEWTD